MKIPSVRLDSKDRPLYIDEIIERGCIKIPLSAFALPIENLGG
jgi:hypothetical protein